MSNILHTSLRCLAAVLVTAGLSACTAPAGGNMHAHHHPAQEAGSAGRPSADMAMGGTAGAATASGQPGQGGMDMRQMCAMHRDIQAAPESQRQAMMDRQMQQMSPEMRQRHMDMMRQHCK
jgi:hypothetical protein